ncbi:hypothetical protein [Kitasatospora sp. NPDC002965]|uniref:hypothetical protein n=1 Tax=Kitasatospora sp. NPDC002965 TaxID=3154775 RepID=UPI0033B4A8A3
MSGVDSTGPGKLRWSGRLGRQPASLREVDGRHLLQIGDRSTLLDARTGVRHRSSLLSRRIIVHHPDRAPFVHRYRLPWMLQLAPLWETAYDRWSAAADDPGLTLIELLGGADDWD